MAGSFFVHNIARRLDTKLSRKLAPTNKGRVQFIDGRKLILNKPLEFSEEELLEKMPIIKEGVRDGYMEVRAPDGRVLDLETLELAPQPAIPPAPKYKLDSIMDDPMTGNPMPIYPNGAVQSVAPPVEVTPEPAPEPPLASEPESMQSVATTTTSQETPPAAPSSEEDVEYVENGSGARPKSQTQPQQHQKGKKGR